MKLRRVFYFSIMIFMVLCSCKEKQANTILAHAVEKREFNKGDTVTPFHNIDLSLEISIIVKVSNEDLEEVSSQIPKATFFKTSNKTVIEKVRDWNFRYTGGDMATVSSSLMIFQNNKQIISCGIVLDKNSVGLQSEEYGWIEAIDSAEIFKTLSLFEN